MLIMAESSEGLQECLNAVRTSARDFKVRFSSEKSQVLVLNEPAEVYEERNIGPIFIKRTKEYKYLGI